jgi:hypothetical protein
MRTRTSFLNSRQQETVSTSFDFREDPRNRDGENGKGKRRSKTCSTRSREGIFIGPAYRNLVERDRSSPVTVRDRGVERMSQAIQVRRLHATRNQERTFPKVIVKDLTADLAQIAPQLPYFKKLPKATPSVTMSRIKIRKHPQASSIQSTRNQMKKLSKPLKKVSIKEALRNKEWTSKAKEKIFKSFFDALNKTNAISPSLPEEVNFTYKYFIGKGNNSKLIEKCLNTRWWWVKVDQDHINEANFIWTQWKSQEIIENLEKFFEKIEKFQGQAEVDSRNKMEITTNIQLFKDGEKPFQVDLSGLGFNRITKAQSFVRLKQSSFESRGLKIYNKLEFNFEISNKKNLFYNLKSFYEEKGKNPFDVIPVTFHVSGRDDENFLKFVKFFKENFDHESFWIVKPGENSNRGNGIEICSSLEEVESVVASSYTSRTFIIQKYIEKPFLIKSRKFDIRCFALMTSINGILQGYFYTEGYIRTSSKPFTLEKTSKFIHLTNDAVQKQSEEYGRFESNNKLSFTDFERYLQLNHSKPVNFSLEILSPIKKIVSETIQATFHKLDPNKRLSSFEVFGYDFLLDQDLKPWLLEVNTNPCLELASSHLTRIIPNMIENALRIVLDPLFQEPVCYLKHLRNNLELVENKFELLFHSRVFDGKGEILTGFLVVPCEDNYCDDESVYSESSTDD